MRRSLHHTPVISHDVSWTGKWLRNMRHMNLLRLMHSSPPFEGWWILKFKRSWHYKGKVTETEVSLGLEKTTLPECRWPGFTLDHWHGNKNPGISLTSQCLLSTKACSDMAPQNCSIAIHSHYSSHFWKRQSYLFLSLFQFIAVPPSFTPVPQPYPVSASLVTSWPSQAQCKSSFLHDVFPDFP